MSATKIERLNKIWRIKCGNLKMELDSRTGVPSAVESLEGKGFSCAGHLNDIIVRDDLLGREFTSRDVIEAQFRHSGESLIIRRRFKGAPWVMKETYSVERDAIRWDSELILEKGAFRSCAVNYRLMLPLPIWPLAVWTAKDGMPTSVHTHPELVMEYGCINSGTSMPVAQVYSEKPDSGLLMAMPFDFKAPLLRFKTSYREEYIEAQFKWMALKPGRPARTCLLFKGTEGHWRPALGWLYKRYKEYFEPRSRIIHKVWGGGYGGDPVWIVTPEEAEFMARLGMESFFLHEHFPGYGEYHPEGVESWINKDYASQNPPPVTVDMVRKAIKRLHDVKSAAHLYIQVNGDGDNELVAPKFPESQMRDIRGKTFSSWYYTTMMNGDPSLPFGKDISRQINGMFQRYPDCDGIWLDQACYNFMDTAHDDGISAYNNRPCYMSGFNYEPHLEMLSGILHPRKAIIANGPYGVGIIKYIDGFMGENGIVQKSLIERYKYYTLAKPLAVAPNWPTTGGHELEMMLQLCLLYGAGYKCYWRYRPEVTSWIQVYKKYAPMLSRMRRRRWIFDANPFALPPGYDGEIYRSERGTLLLSVVAAIARAGAGRVDGLATHVRTRDSARAAKVTIQQPGGRIEPVKFGKEKNGIQFDLPGRTVAGLVEIHLK